MEYLLITRGCNEGGSTIKTVIIILILSCLLLVIAKLKNTF